MPFIVFLVYQSESMQKNGAFKGLTEDNLTKRLFIYRSMVNVKLERIGETQQWQVVSTPLPDGKGRECCYQSPAEATI